MATFAGLTRDTFDGKRVRYLGYECYRAMALHQMQILCQDLFQKYSSLRGLVIYHRVGEVPAGECSVLIVAASPHRVHALQAAAEGIDLVKTRVPIWKKEFYEGEDGEIDGSAWKQNAEYELLL